MRLADHALSVLAVGEDRRTGQKLANAAGLRGFAYRAVSAAAHQALDTGSVARVGDFVSAPIKHPLDHRTVAAAVGTNAVDVVADSAAFWVWDLPPEAGPPRLYLAPAAADLFGVDLVYRDRAVHGVADYFSRALSLGQSLSHLDWIFDTESPAFYTEDMPVRRDNADRVVLDVVEAKIDQRTLVGLGRIQHETEWSHRLADALLADAFVTVDSRHVALLDVRFPAAPFVLRWLGGPPPGIGHGLSTGQNSGFHPDDQPAVAAAIIGAGAGTVTTMSARVRTLNGQWMRVTAKAWWVAHDIAPGIVAVAVESYSIEP